MHHHNPSKIPCLLAAAAMTLAAPALAADIANITSTDRSVADGPMWQHDVSVGSVSRSGKAFSFTQQTQLVNSYVATGGNAQVHPRKSTWLLEFTVEDEAGVGFTLDIDQLLRGYAELNVTSGQGNVTGVSYYVKSGDSTDGESLSVDTSLFIGTNGFSVEASDTPPTRRELATSSKSERFGTYVGTTNFAFDYTNVFTPTTNIFFGNDATGSGQLNYGLGTGQAGDAFSAAELGHFFTVTATFTAVPEPGAATAAGVIGVGMLLRRRRA